MSASLVCSCDSGIPNTGQPGCIDGFSRDARFIIVPYKDNAGNINSIKLADFVAGVLPLAFITAKINEADKSKRWFITEEFRLPTPERAEPVTEDIDGVGTVVRQGNKTYSVAFIGKKGNPQYAGRLNAICQDFGVFSIDVDGRIKGMFVNSELRPTRVENGTVNAIYMEPTADTQQKVMLGFTVNLTENDGNLSFIEKSHLGADMLDVKGLIDVSAGDATGITTTMFTSKLTFCYGEAFNNMKFKGAVLADFVLAQISPTPAAVTILTVTESPDGTYKFTFAAETTGDVLKLTLTKSGFEMEPLLITIP